MKNIIKFGTASAAAILLAACASTTDPKYYVDTDADADRFAATNSDVELPDEMQFGVDDDDEFEAVVTGTTTVAIQPTAVASRTINNDTNIVEAAMATESLSTLVSLVKQAELVETLSGPGPFTVFAPTNDAFAMLPAEKTEKLTMDENRDKLQKVLKAHVVSGNILSTDLIGLIDENDGRYTAETVSGDTLTFYVMDGEVKVADERNMIGTVQIADLTQSNGVVHVVNSVLVPK